MKRQQTAVNVFRYVGDSSMRIHPSVSIILLYTIIYGIQYDYNFSLQYALFTVQRGLLLNVKQTVICSMLLKLVIVGNVEVVQLLVTTATKVICK